MDGDYVSKMPWKPESGTLWKYYAEGATKNNWKATGYRWVEPSGRKLESDGEVVKHMFNVSTPESDNKRGN